MSPSIRILVANRKLCLTFKSRTKETYIGDPVIVESYRVGEDFRAPGARIHSNVHDIALFSIGVMKYIYVPEELFFDGMMKCHN